VTLPPQDGNATALHTVRLIDQHEGQTGDGRGRRRKNRMTNDGPLTKPEPTPPALWRRLGQQAVLGAAGALGATLVTWLRTWLEGHNG
jgi:hypothetical protein